MLDAVVGALVILVSFLLQFLLSGHGAFVPPIDAPDGPLGELAAGRGEPSEQWPARRSAVEDLLDDPAGPPGGTAVIVDELPRNEAGWLAERAADGHQQRS